MRSCVVFKFLNYVTDKIIRVVLTNQPYVKVCANHMVSVREERERGETETERERE